MALNRFMHPRNPYKDKKPDFKSLAVKYTEFRKYATQDIRGAVHIDFKKAECLRALSWVLLKEDFDLDVEMPLDRLIPTVPLRLNYILWIEDLIAPKEEECNKSLITGIDIGCGSSCIYPLLGAKKNNWQFLSSEVDSINLQYARRNVVTNSLEGKITIVEVKEDSGLVELLDGDDKTYDFCMCNPPFFGSNLEAWGTYTTRNDSRPDPKSVSTASPKESVVPGGEVNFVKRMIMDSLILKDKIRIYTAMLGKKSSIGPLKSELQSQKISSIGITEFSQGRTMRWGIGWTFDSTVRFPKPPTQMVKKKKDEKPQPLVYVIPSESASVPDNIYSVGMLGCKVMQILEEYKIKFEPERSGPEVMVIEVVAIENTWVHQRRKRREAMRMKSKDKGNTRDVNDGTPCTDSKDGLPVDGDSEGGAKSHPAKIRKIHDINTEIDSAENKQIEKCTVQNDDVSGHKMEQSTASIKLNSDSVEELREESFSNSEQIDISIEDISKYILKCKLTLRKIDEKIQLEMLWIDGEKKELLHQLIQVFKNKLK